MCASGYTVRVQRSTFACLQWGLLMISDTGATFSEVPIMRTRSTWSLSFTKHSSKLSVSFSPKKVMSGCGNSLKPKVYNTGMLSPSLSMVGTTAHPRPRCPIVRCVFVYCSLPFSSLFPNHCNFCTKAPLPA
jgi:hypothetical protein